jgi:hypothetical protein
MTFLGALRCDQLTALQVLREEEITWKFLRKMERVKGIEPSSSAWKAVALPLSYTREEAVLR